MQVFVETGAWEEVQAENLALFLYEGEKADVYTLPPNLLKWLEQTVFDSGDFSGKADELLTVYFEEKPKRIFLVGLGEKGEFSLEKFRQAIGRLMKAVKKQQENVTLGLRSFDDKRIKESEISQAAVEAAELAVYQFD